MHSYMSLGVPQTPRSYNTLYSKSYEMWKPLSVSQSHQDWGLWTFSSNLAECLSPPNFGRYAKPYFNLGEGVRILQPPRFFDIPTALLSGSCCAQHASANEKQATIKAIRFCKQCLHDLQFMKKRYSSPNLSKLTRADISCQFYEIKVLLRADTVYKKNGL